MGVYNGPVSPDTAFDVFVERCSPVRGVYVDLTVRNRKWNTTTTGLIEVNLRKQTYENPTKPIEKTKSRTREVQQEEVLCPMFKVYLIWDEKYDRDHVTMILQSIIPDCDVNTAVGIFELAQEEGMALCGIYPEEHAELYVEELLRAEPMVYSEMKEE